MLVPTRLTIFLFGTPWLIALAFDDEWNGIYAPIVESEVDQEGPDPKSRWRLAEPSGEFPIGTEVEVKENSLCRVGDHGVIETESGAVHVEKISDDHIEELIERRTPKFGPWASPVEDLCIDGRFFLNDGRVGLFNNQRLSYEVSINVAKILGRTLVIPGFFKFPHDMAADGIQWTALSRLFNWTAVEDCYADVIEMEELIERCGPDVLDGHVTVPFAQESLVVQKRRPPWFKGTRRWITWSSSNESKIDLASRVKTAFMIPLTPLRTMEPTWRLVRPFLRPDVARARTVRADGLMVNQHRLGDATACLEPNDEMKKGAKIILDEMTHRASKLNAESRSLAVHIRKFKNDPNQAGGFLEEGHEKNTERLCNFPPSDFRVLAHLSLMTAFKGWTPTNSYVATNEGDKNLLMKYSADLPIVSVNPMEIKFFEKAISHEENYWALRSIVLDATVCALADRFIGNTCSTMSQYIWRLRLAWGKGTGTATMIGGERQSELLEKVRKEADGFVKLADEM